MTGARWAYSRRRSCKTHVVPWPASRVPSSAKCLRQLGSHMEYHLVDCKDPAGPDQPHSVPPSLDLQSHHHQNQQC